jgi:hypothetical protein
MDYRLMMNQTECGWKRWWPDLTKYPGICPGIEENCETSQ